MLYFDFSHYLCKEKYTVEQLIMNKMTLQTTTMIVHTIRVI